MSDQNQGDNLIPIDTIEAVDEVDDGPFMPRALEDDPNINDGSASREGVEVSSWRLRTIGADRLMSVSDPDGSDRRSRQARRAHTASRKARTKRGRTVRGRVRVAVGLLLALVVAGMAYAGISYVYEQWGGKTIPYVVGLTQLNATEELEAKGLSVTVEEVPSDAMAGRVVEVSPAQGQRVDEGSTVHLRVGSDRTIPEVVGLTREEARSALEAAGAQNIRFESQVSVDAEDKVLEVRPAAGSVFMSSEEVTLVVSQLPRMLDVVGEEEDMALAHLEKEGIAAQSQMERGTAEERLHVIRTTPAAGETVGEEGAVVVVGDPLIQAMRLEDYFDADGSHILEFLASEGYEPTLGYMTKEGHLKARFENELGMLLSFEESPWTRGIDSEQSGYAQVMDDSVDIEGVRLAMSFTKDNYEQAETDEKDEEGNPVKKTVVTSTTPVSIPGIGNPSVGESTANDVMALCGFSDMMGSCTQANATFPKGTNTSGRIFYCCYGESAQSVWTVLIEGQSSNGKTEATKVVATCAPKASYAVVDLTQYGNSICNYVAYQELYQ